MMFLSTFFVCSAFAIDSMMLMMMMQQNQSPNQASQINEMLPFLLLSESDSKASENSDMLMYMMMQNGGNFGDMESMMPLLMLR